MKNKWLSVLSKALFGLFLCVLLTGAATAAVNDSEFITLCGGGSLQQVNNAIKSGANVNARNDNGITPLMSAIWSNPSTGVITALISAGADVNAKNNAGVTPLMYASKKSKQDVVTILLNHGAAPITNEIETLTAAANPNAKTETEIDEAFERLKNEILTAQPASNPVSADNAVNSVKN